MAAVVVASTATFAVAASTTTVGTAGVKVGGKSRTVVGDSSGATLYTLSGERVDHLKCVSSTCFGFWPPYKVSATAKLTKAKGISGTLSKLHRINGKFYQVVLNGQPLYRFAPDKGKKGSASGEGIQSFGGTWHVVPAR
jgi:predicted lipoprotein with Yx(FWY)xxD motif